MDKNVKDTVDCLFTQRGITRLLLCCVIVMQFLMPRPVFAQGEQTSASNVDQTAKPRHLPDVAAWKQKHESALKAIKDQKRIEALADFQAALILAEDFEPKDRRLVDTIHELGCCYSYDQVYSNAEPLFRREVELVRGDPNCVLEIRSLIALGHICGKLRKFDEGEKYLIDAAKIATTKRHSDDALLGYCQQYLGELYQDKGDLTNAESNFRLALHADLLTSSRDEIQPSGSAVFSVRTVSYSHLYERDSVVSVMDHLTDVYVALNQPENAAALLERAVKYPGADQSNRIFFMKKLSRLYHGAANYTEADFVLKRLEPLQERYLGIKHPATLHTLSNMASLYDKAAKFSDEENALRKILASAEERPATNATFIEASVDNLGRFFFERQRYAEAEKMFRRNLDYEQKTRGDKIDLDLIIAKLVPIYIKLGRDAELEAVYKKRIDIFGKAFGEDNKMLTQPLLDYAAILRKEKKDSKADKAEARARALGSTAHK